MKLKIIAIAALLSTICSACTFNKSINPEGEKEAQAKSLANVAVGYTELGQQDKASQLFAQALDHAQSMQESSGLKGSVLAEVAISNAEAGQYNQALQIVESIQPIKYDNSEIEPSNIYRTIALYQLAAKATEAGHYDQALEFIEKLGNGGVMYGGYEDNKAKALTKVVDEATKAESSAKAVQILTQALELTKTLDQKDRADTIAEIAVNYAQVGQQLKAEQLLNQALRIALAIEDTYVANKADALAEVAASYAQVGQQAKAEQLLNQALQKANGTALSLAEVAVSYAQVGQQAKAEQVINQALQIVKTAKGDKKNKLTEIATKYAEVGLYDQALQVVELKDRWYVHRNPDVLNWAFTYPDALSEIALMYAEAGRYDLALQTAKSIKYGGNRADTLAKLAVAYAQGRQYDQALEIIQSLDTESFKGIDVSFLKANALPQIVDKATQAEPKDKAQQILAQALQLVETNWSNDEKAQVLAVIASQYAKVGQKNKAEQLLAQALQLAKTAGLVRVSF